MIKEQVDKYFNNFRRELGKYLKPNIGITISIYPYSSGIVSVVEFDEEASKTFYKSESNSLAEAMSKTNIFQNDSPQVSVNGVSIILFESYIVIIKNDNSKQYEESAVKRDVQNIIIQIRNR